MADEARNLKQYKELPENSKSSLVSDTNLYQWLMRFCAAVRVNETDTFADEEGLNDEYFDFEDISGKFLCYKLPAGRLCCPLLTYAYSLHFCICRDLGEASSSHLAFGVWSAAMCSFTTLRYCASAAILCYHQLFCPNSVTNINCSTFESHVENRFAFVIHCA